MTTFIIVWLTGSLATALMFLVRSQLDASFFHPKAPWERREGSPPTYRAWETGVMVVVFWPIHMFLGILKTWNMTEPWKNWFS